jgi:DNA-directed RNA polymerase specialized sigma24 family protein
MNDDELELLRALDWEEIGAKVANFADSEARNRYNWKGGAMTKGSSPEDLACDAIAEFWQNPSRRPEGCSLTTFLCGIVKNKLWNVSQWKETRTTDRENDMEAVAGFAACPPPDVALTSSDAFSSGIALLSEHVAVKGKADHELVVTALGCGCFDPDELAKETGLPIKRVYQVQRELNAIYPTNKKQHLTEKGASHASKQ